jgi:predicted transcriptional regulator
MLNKAEEDILENIIETIGTASWGQYPEADLNEVKWLIRKLKEAEAEIRKLNDENNDLCTENTELVLEIVRRQTNQDQMDKMLATALQVIEDAGVMSEYLKFRTQ